MSVGTTAVRLCEADDRRKLLRFTNLDAATAGFIGGNRDVRTTGDTGGERVAAGGGDVWDGFTGELWAIATGAITFGVLEVLDDVSPLAKPSTAPGAAGFRNPFVLG